MKRFMLALAVIAAATATWAVMPGQQSCAKGKMSEVCQRCCDAPNCAFRGSCPC